MGDQNPSARADATLEQQRRIQLEQDTRDQAKGKGGGAKRQQAVQAGAREHPTELPAQHLDKPGIEAEMQLKPQFLAPDYEGSRKLRDCTALITGGDSGIGRAVAVLRLDETLRTNIYGYFHMAKAALPHLQRGASIINTGSVTGLEGSAKLLDYSATKGAIHAFTKSLAQNLLDKGIRVNAVAPGPVWTPLNPADSPPEKVQQFGKHTDMKRAAQPEELSPAYVFLASPVCSSYITGVVLPVTGSVGAI